MDVTGLRAAQKTECKTSATVADLTRRMAATDEAAFREFHQHYFDRLLQFHLAVTQGREDEAKEAMQQTLLRVVRHIRVFEEEETFWCWLKAVARSAVRDASRKERRYVSLLLRFAQNSPVKEAEQPEESQLRHALEEALGELGVEERRMFESKYLDGIKLKEIARADGLTEKAVEGRLARLKQRLRERLLQKLAKR